MYKSLIFFLSLLLVFNNSFSQTRDIENKIQTKFNSLISLEYQIISVLKDIQKENCLSSLNNKRFNVILEKSETNFRELIKLVEELQETVNKSREYKSITEESTSFLLGRFVEHLSLKNSYESCK